jgi:glycosyltransferase involved in cell wall biosynthesis
MIEYATIHAMRIGLQAHIIFNEPGKNAGVSRANLRILEELVKCKEHDFVIFNRRGFVLSKEISDLPNVTLCSPWNRFRMWDFFGRNLVQFTHKLDFFFALSGKVPTLKKVKSGSIICDIFCVKYPDMFTTDLRKKHEVLYAQVAKNADIVACISEATKKEFADYYKVPNERLFTIPLSIGQSYNRVDLSEVKDEELIALGINPSQKYLFVISTIEPRKNLERLFEAYAMLIKDQKYKDVQLVIAGAKGWKDSEIYAKLKALSLDNTIKFLGYIEDEMVPKLFAKAEYCVVPSIDEGFGMPALEALHFGAPLISSNAGSLPEVGGELPVYFDPFDTNDILNALKTGLNQDNREDLIKRGFERAGMFTWELAAKTIINQIVAAVKK